MPWIDEKVYEDKTTESTSNTQFTYEELWKKVIADFQTEHSDAGNHIFLGRVITTRMLSLSLNVWFVKTY